MGCANIRVMMKGESNEPTLSIEGLEEEARLDYLDGRTEPMDIEEMMNRPPSITPTSSETSPS